MQGGKSGRSERKGREHSDNRELVLPDAGGQGERSRSRADLVEGTRDLPGLVPRPQQDADQGVGGSTRLLALQAQAEQEAIDRVLIGTLEPAAVVPAVVVVVVVVVLKGQPLPAV